MDLRLAIRIPCHFVFIDWSSGCFVCSWYLKWSKLITLLMMLISSHRSTNVLLVNCFQVVTEQIRIASRTERSTMTQIRRAYTVHGYDLPTGVPPNQQRTHLIGLLLGTCDALIEAGRGEDDGGDSS